MRNLELLRDEVFGLFQEKEKEKPGHEDNGPDAVNEVMVTVKGPEALQIVLGEPDLARCNYDDEEASGTSLYDFAKSIVWYEVGKMQQPDPENDERLIIDRTSNGWKLGSEYFGTMEDQRKHHFQFISVYGFLKPAQNVVPE